MSTRARIRYTALAAAIAASLMVPAAASAVTAPTPTAPTPGSSATQGESVTFTWDGTLQGDLTALDRSFFVVQIISAAQQPAGVDAAWDAAEVSQPTTPGKMVGTLTLGVPTAGAWRWRVCAMGVANSAVSPAISQLPGGCSAARALTSVAPVVHKAAPGTLKIEHTQRVGGGARYVHRYSDTTTTQAPTDKTIYRDVAPSAPKRPPVAAAPVQVREPLTSGAAEQVRLSAQASDTNSDSGLSRAMNATLPLLPIPFWTLLLLGVCVPLARMWRASVVAMFDDESYAGEQASTSGNLH